MPDKLETLAAAMEDLGIASEEARVYLALLKNGPARASTAAKLTGFSRGRIYRILDTLAEMEWIAVQLGHPRIYEPLPPERLFTQRISELEREEMQIETLKEEILPRLRAIGDGPGQGAGPNWSLIEGRLPIYRSLIKMIEHAEETVEVASNHRVTSSPIPVVRAAWQALAARVEAGVAARCLVPSDWQMAGEEGQAGEERGLPEIQGLEIKRMGRKPPVHLVIVDGRDAMQWLVLEEPADNIRGDVAVRSDAEGLVGPARLLFETLWTNAEER